ncbi:MAG: WD40 repeat domain-containing protein [Caldilineae bacterium]|nr:MAG: WD40 repeat domain-containing protein [Caldilineae bacterium]
MTPVEERVFPAHESYVLGLRFTADSRALVSAGMDNVVKVWSVSDWALQREFRGHANSVNGFALTGDESLLVTGSSDKTVKVWSFREGKLLRTLQDRKQVVAAVDVARDGRWLAAASYGGRLALWSREGEPVLGKKLSRQNLASVAISPDGGLVTTAGLGEDVWVLSLPGGEPVATLQADETAVWGLQFIAGGKQLVTLGYGGGITFWDTATWQLLRSIRASSPGVRGLAFSPDEKLVALSREGRVEWWDVEGWQQMAELAVSTKVINGMAFSPDGRRFAAGAADKKIRVWQLV